MDKTYINNVNKFRTELANGSNKRLHEIPCKNAYVQNKHELFPKENTTLERYYIQLGDCNILKCMKELERGIYKKTTILDKDDPRIYELDETSHMSYYSINDIDKKYKDYQIRFIKDKSYTKIVEKKVFGIKFTKCILIEEGSYKKTTYDI